MTTEITIISGKGGAGKTFITAAFASLAQNSVFCDNDVDAADLHLIFSPQIIKTFSFSSGKLAVINEAICTGCGICIENCRFDAIYVNGYSKPQIKSFGCEGCLLCERLCPAGAIRSIQNNNNRWFISETRFGTLIHAQMAPGGENTGKLVTEIRSEAKQIAKQSSAAFVVNDGPPGIGCAAIASVTGADLVVLVVEPSVSGIHDAKRALQLVKSFNIQSLAIINKSDLNKEQTAAAEQFLSENKIPLLGKIPFHTDVVNSIVNGKTIIEFNPASEISFTLREIWEKLAYFAIGKTAGKSMSQ